MKRLLALLSAAGAAGTIYDNWGDPTVKTVLFSLFCAWAALSLWKGHEDDEDN